MLPPGTSIPDGPLTLALLDIAYAARNGEPTNYLVSRACFEFSKVAAALEPKAVGKPMLDGSLESLKQVIDKNWTVEQAPELFCFGLLEAFDIKQIRALGASP